MRRVSTATSAWVPSSWRRVTPENPTPGVTYFSIGTGLSDAEREAPPKIGAVVGFRYQELSDDGVPRFPSYVGERIDVELPPARPPRAAKRKPSERVR